MGLRDCLLSAAEQGAITRQEASALGNDFEERFAQARLSMGDDLAAAQARKDMESAYRIKAIEDRRKADLTEAARLRVKDTLMPVDGETDIFRNAMALLSHYGFRGVSSMRGKAEAITAASHAKIADVMFAFRRKGVLGKRENASLMPDLIRELHGEHSGDATAKYLAQSISGVFEDLRQRFNAAGGAIGKLDNFGLPHSHDRLKVKAMGRDAWKGFIRELIDPAKIKDPLTGQMIIGKRLDDLLDHAYENIVSEGRAHLKPQQRPMGKGAIASQRADERILVFRDAESWMTYHNQAGRGDPVQAIFNHINGMAKDIGAMETFGPNPQAMVEYAKQIVVREIGRQEAGLPSLAKAGLLKDSQAKWAEYRIDGLYQTLRGNPQVVSGFANLTATIKNIQVAAQLGATAILAAATDPFISASSRRLAGLPVTSTFMPMLKNLAQGTRDDIVRSGVIWDEYLHVMGDEFRFAGPALGAEWSRWIADRSVMFSGLKPLTTGRKLVEARAWQSHIADLAKEGKAFDRLDPRLKRALEGFGINRTHWDIWKQSIDPNGFVTGRQIELNGGSVAYLDMAKLQVTDPAYLAEQKALMHREAAEKLSELISSWSERAVPQGTPNARAAISGGLKRGTLPGELVDYVLQYKAFGLSFTTLQLEAIGEMAGAKGGGTGARSGLGYFAAMAVPLTLAGGLYIQMRGLLDGKDPEDMREPNFWIRAGLQGGGLGLFGDFVKASENRFGQGLQGALSGPGLAFLGDAFGLTLGNVMELARREKAKDGGTKPTRAGRELVQFLGRYTPVASSHWALRGAYRRVVLDNLQWLIDPEADKSFKAQAAAATKNGAAFFAPPGTFTPSTKAGRTRAPDFRSAIGGAQAR